MDNDDMELVRQYVTSQCESAFAALVSRYTNLVYSAAFRRTGNSQLAEEITQAVFTILAQKADTLDKKTILPGWLYRAACYVSGAAIKQELRRRRREEEAYMQSVSNQTEPEVWTQITPLLEEAMMRLGKAERDALVLRFVEGHSFKEVGTALGASEAATKMRVNRALEKLRVYFSRHGVNSTAGTIAGAMSANFVMAAPPTLAKMSTAVALAKGAAASTSTLTLAKGALKLMAWTKTKTTIAGVTAALLTIGGGICLVNHFAKPHGLGIVADTVPVHVANATFRQDGDRNGRFIVEVDHHTLRTANSAPSIHIGGPIGPGGSIVSFPATANGSYSKSDNSSSTVYIVTPRSVLYGKRVCITGWLKTKDVRGWASAFAIIVGKDRNPLQYDDMSDRPIRGTTDWQQIQIVTDLPDAPCGIYFGPDLYGPGELWADDFEITPAPPDTPTTDDRNWRIATEDDPTAYSETTDVNVTHDGHPATCLTYTPDGPARRTHMFWGHDYYGSESDQYRGHTVRMTGWLKTENVTGRIVPVVLPYAGWGKLLGQDRNSSFKGTHDWTQFTVTCDVPKGTESLTTGINFYGGGNVWIDKDSIKLEIVSSD